MSTIQPLTHECLCSAARDAARDCVPLNEANHYEQGTQLWCEFNTAYQAAQLEAEPVV